MLSISSRVQTWLDRNPTTAQYLSEGLINHSALARNIKKDIERMQQERISIESITIALNRAGRSMNTAKKTDPLYFIGDVSVQTDLSILNYDIANFDTLVLPSAEDRQKGYFVSTRGIWHASIITTADIAATKALRTTAQSVEESITSITIRLKPGHIPVPGVCAGILSFLSHMGVNFKEVISTHSELTVLADQQNAQRALNVLMNYKNTEAIAL